MRCLKDAPQAGWWWRTPLIPALGRQRQVSEFEASLVYKVSYRTARTTQRNPVSKTNKQTNEQIKGHTRKETFYPGWGYSLVLGSFLDWYS